MNLTGRRSSRSELAGAFRPDETGRVRSYGQFCPIARGSEVLAERWTPIILRNVLMGCHTFNEIAAGAPGLSRALLTRRLRELGRAGVIEIRPKTDGRGSIYEPTIQGRELWDVLQALGGWAERWMEVTSEGRLITPSDPDYDPARAVWNGAIDRRPRYIARCGSASDVIAALRFGRHRDLPMSVRGGGHGVAGTAVCDDGLVVDLSPMKAIAIDPAKRTATVQAGVRWGELDAATKALGMATTGGTMSRTGVAGLTPGGGIGWLMRRHGLTVDNLLAADMVTADGEHLTASEREHPDLFWGLRGGGGGLGAVTSFSYRLHHVGPEVLGGLVLWALEDTPDVLAAYRELIAAAPCEVSTALALRRAPPAPFLPRGLHRRPICAVGMVALGDPATAEKLLAPPAPHRPAVARPRQAPPLHRPPIDARRRQPRRVALLLEVDRPAAARWRRDRHHG